MRPEKILKKLRLLIEQLKEQCELNGQRLEVWFEDESRFGQQGTLTRVWAPKGSRPRAVRQTQYEYLWALGAACPETGQSCGLLLPRVNTEGINLFLQELSDRLDPGVIALVVWDGAPFHRSRGIVMPLNIRLIQLPPYSPELNPIENLWHYLKSHFWSNRFYENYDALLDAATVGWNCVSSRVDIIKSVCSAAYI